MSSIAKVSQQIVDQYNHYFQRGLSLSVFDSPSFPEFSQFPVTSQYFPFLASFCQRSGTYFRKWSYFLTKFCQLVSIFNTNDINSEPIAEIILPSWNHLIGFVYPYMGLILAENWRLREGPLGLAVKRWNITYSKAGNGQNEPWMQPFLFKQF